MVQKLYGPQVQGLQGAVQQGRAGAARQPLKGQPDFREILRKTAKPAGPSQVTLSAHAQKRLEQRSISLSPEDMMRLNNAVDQAARKGSRESLVMLNDLALVVSVANKTVITAMGVDGMKDSVVTNIDSAVFA